MPERIYKMFSSHHVHILFIVYCIQIYVSVLCVDNVTEEDYTVSEVKTINLIDELHSLYKDAFENEKTYLTRRFFAKDGITQFTLHVKKLREVNGVKTHNLKIEERSGHGEPIIYINNPVEARMPNPFLGLEEFKKFMFERVENEKKEFNAKKNQPFNHYNQIKAKLHDKIFDIHKHVKQELEARQKAEKLKKTLPKEHPKLNKKRKPKSHFTTKSTKKAHRKTTTASSEETDDDLVTTDSNYETETVTEMEDFEDVTTESIVDKYLTTDTEAGGEITTTMVAIEDIVTESIADVKTTTSTGENITAVITAEDKITTEKVSVGEVNTETIPDTTTNKIPDTTTKKMLQTTSETIPNATNETMSVTSTETMPLNTIENITEITTEKIPDTTTETTVKTTKTRQARPYVFMGSK